MSVSGPSPLGTLMLQRVEQALGVTVSQQANIATGARPDAVTQPGQPDKTDPLKNPPPKSEEGARQPPNRQALAALARNDPDIAKLLAARNAPMTSYTSSAPTSLGQTAKTILALLQSFPNVQPVVTGRAPLLSSPPGQGTPGASGQSGGAPGAGAPASAPPVAGQLDPRAVEALAQRGQGGEGQGGSAGQGGTQQTPANTQQPAAAGNSGNPATSAQGTANTPGASPQSAPPPGNQPAATPAPNPQASARGAHTSAATTRAAAPAATAARSAASQPATPGRASTPANGPATSTFSSVPTGIAGQLSQALSQAIQGSGLFYESHLREFTFGQRTLEQLRAEPQAQSARAMDGNAAPQSGGANNARGPVPSEPGSQATGQSGTASTPAAPHPHQASAQLAGALLGMDPSTQVLVRQQLEVLANQAFAWQGEAWPGSELEWEVQRREPHGGEGQETESWSTRLKLQLPGLGEVHARLSLSDTQLIMHLAAPECATIMADHTTELRERLGLHGLQLSQLTISHDSGFGSGGQT